MDAESRLREAIKQTCLAIEEVNQSDVLEVLEEGQDRLQVGLESLEDRD